jgi:hypothetical protein
MWTSSRSETVMEGRLIGIEAIRRHALRVIGVGREGRSR